MVEAALAAPPAASPSRPRQTALIRLLVFACGWVLMSMEILGGRLLQPYFGSTVFVWGSLISTFLVSLSLGYYAGGLLSRRWARPEPLCAIVAAAGLLTLVVPLVHEPVNDFLFDSLSDERAGPLAAAALLFFVPSFLLGVVSPYAVQLSASHLDRVGATAGQLWALSTVGSTLGTLATTFWLIPEFRVSTILFVSGGALAVLGLGSWLGVRRLGLWALWLLVAAGPAWAGQKVLYRADSPYTTVMVLEKGPYRYLSFRVKGDLVEQSCVDVRQPRRLVYEYTQMMLLGLAFQDKPRDILVMGLGAGSLSMALADLCPQARIDTVEIDPEVIHAARTYFFYAESSRVRTYQEDARVYVRRCPKKYDLVFFDAYEGLGIPFHLKTREFYDLVKRVLRPGGALVVNLHPGPSLYSSERRTLLASFAQNYCFRGVQQFNAVVVARQDGPLYRSKEQVVARARQVQSRLRLPYDLAGHAAKMVLGQDWSSDATILTDDYAPVEILRQR